MRHCINHGEQNPRSMYPDWFCGKLFKDIPKLPDWKKAESDAEDREPCFGHPGYVKRTRANPEGEWTCCGEVNNEATMPCTEMEHKVAFWPDEEAKKYFYDKPMRDDKNKSLPHEMEIYGRFSGYFRKTEEYVHQDSPEIL